MSFLKALCISFAIFSKIPVPHFDWEEKEMRYQLIFFPWVGAVIGLLLFIWTKLSLKVGISSIAFVLIGVAMPIIVTGGFHVDGFMDVMDAIKSYQPKEKKLEILKDPHIGAFAVIMLALLGLVYTAAFSQISTTVMWSFVGCFFTSRAFSGIAVLKFPDAKKNGMLHTFDSSTEGKARQLVFYLLAAQAVIGIAYMIIMSPVAGLMETLAVILAFIYYRYRSMKEFGGITGDTAGYFVVISETSMAIAAAIASLILTALA